MLRGGAGERLGLSAGDELLGVGDWRLRRLDDAQRLLLDSGTVPLFVARDQRIVTLAIEATALPGNEAGALQLRRAESANAEARALGEAWFTG